MKQERKVALVLGGGAARGFAHLGVLKVFKRENIPTDLIVGTSIGSLIGAIYALDLPLEEAIHRALRMSWKAVVDVTISKMSLAEGRRLEDIIIESVHGKNFEDAKIPIAAVATNIENAQETVFTEGNLVQSIRASCSLSGIFNPVRIGEHLYVDGGVVNPVPVSVARRLGGRFIIAVDVGYCVRVGKVENIFQVIYQSFQIMGKEMSAYQVMAASELIQPKLGDMDQFAFHRAQEAIAAGEEAAENALPDLLSKLKARGYIS